AGPSRGAGVRFAPDRLRAARGLEGRAAPSPHADGVPAPDAPRAERRPRAHPPPDPEGGLGAVLGEPDALCPRPEGGAAEEDRGRSRTAEAPGDRARGRLPPAGSRYGVTIGSTCTRASLKQAPPPRSVRESGARAFAVAPFSVLWLQIPFGSATTPS